MFVCLWSAKGGSGVSVTAASLSLALAQCQTDVLLVDFAGDLASVLGAPPPARTADPDDFLGCEREVAPGVNLVEGPAFALDADSAAAIGASLSLDRRPVIVDLGTATDLVGPFARHADETLLVTRACYLALRRATAVPIRPDGVIVVEEPGRALRATDVADVIGAPVRACLPVTPEVARAVDAGLLATRMPPALARPLLSLCHVPS